LETIPKETAERIGSRVYGEETVHGKDIAVSGEGYLLSMGRRLSTRILSMGRRKAIIRRMRSMGKRNSIRRLSTRRRLSMGKINSIGWRLDKKENVHGNEKFHQRRLSTKGYSPWERERPREE